ncbi:hypothetical protein [Burkholderia contaminans]|uniref:Uncharacterized protein n=1 Tax=Burkholderia contaminans TaxID=488447 RepID=A0A6P2Y974_9BURK|nr:hypothetical protein [Burkholderia contaminans]VWD17248.1 hypothetical protein BCO71171_02938 [Burkholderia contaminans]
MKIFDAAKDLPDELRTVLDDITDALDARANADRAAANNRDAITAGDDRIAELEVSSKELDAQAIKAEVAAAANTTVRAEATKAAKAADKAASELDDARRAHERRVAAVDLLNAEARSIDESIPELKKRLQAAMGSYRKQMLAAVNEDLIKACAPLIPIIRAIAAVDAVLPNGGLAHDWLDCAKLISPVGYHSDHMHHHVRVSGTDLLASNDPLPELPTGAAIAIQEIVSVSTALRQHRAFQPPTPQAHQTETRQRSAREQQRFDEAAKRIRQSEEEYDRREARAKLPPKNRSELSEVRQPGTPVPRRERNMNFSANLDGSISDEWRAIGVSDGDCR